MKAWLLCVLSLLSVSRTVLSCSCVPGAFSVPRDNVIRSDFCRSSMVYIGRVVGATCNCYTGTTLGCVNYGYTNAQEMTGLTANVTAVGECAGAQFRNIGLTMCANLSRALSLSVDEVDVLPVSDLPTVNLTAMAESGFCPNICPFNTDGDSDVPPDPCQYTVELVEVFKPINYTGATTITAIGPDVLTTCGNLGRRLAIGETYLAGVGGGCSPIGDWSRSQSFSTAELNLLRTANQNIMCGAMASVPSLPTLVLSVLLILLVAA